MMTNQGMMKVIKQETNKKMFLKIFQQKVKFSTNINIFSQLNQESWRKFASLGVKCGVCNCGQGIVLVLQSSGY